MKKPGEKDDDEESGDYILKEGSANGEPEEESDLEGTGCENTLEDPNADVKPSQVPREEYDEGSESFEFEEYGYDDTLDVPDKASEKSDVVPEISGDGLP